MATTRKPTTRRRKAPVQTMEIKAHIGHMTPETIEKHALNMVNNHKPLDLITLKKYVTEVMSLVSSALIESGYEPDKGQIWNGFKIGMGNRKYVEGLTDTPEIKKMRADLIGAEAKVKALKKKLNILIDYEILKGNGKKEDNKFYTCSFIKKEGE